MSVERRAQLADFLRARRQALRPEDVGLKVGQTSRRRTPGLRREEVADLAGISVSWYTCLEQGRKIQVSEQVLERLGSALKLTWDEYGHLATLCNSHTPGCASVPGHDAVRPSVLRILESQDPFPAYVLGPRFDLLAWNQATVNVYGDPSAIEPERRHVLWLLFGGYLRDRIVNWAPNAQFALAAFRAATGGYVHEPWFGTLIRNLGERSAEFRLWWSWHDVERRPVGYKELQHPLVGRLVLEQTALLVDDCSGQRIILCRPQPATGIESKLLELARTSTDCMTEARRAASRTRLARSCTLRSYMRSHSAPLASAKQVAELAARTSRAVSRSSDDVEDGEGPVHEAPCPSGGGGDVRAVDKPECADGEIS